MMRDDTKIKIINELFPHVETALPFSYVLEKSGAKDARSLRGALGYLRNRYGVDIRQKWGILKRVK